MTAHPIPMQSSPLALSLRMEFDRAKLPLDGEAHVRLILEMPQASVAAAGARKGLALAVSLDCSGSMNDPAGAPDGSPMQFSIPRMGIFQATLPGSDKLSRCKVAVWEAVELLNDGDMASLTAFSSMAKTLFPMAPMTAENKALFKAALDKVTAGGGTALHDGWAEAGREAAKGIDRNLLCRVALLTDGEASTGERNAEVLAKHSAGLAKAGVSTSCFGVGASFNEDLLCAMADAGEGNFRYIPDAMLAAAAALDEVNGLGATAGRRAKLRLTGVEGIESIEILNAFDIEGDWRKLPTLLAGRPIEALAKIKLSASGALAKVFAEVHWENRDGILQSAELEASAPLASAEESLASPQDPEVAGAAGAFLAAKAKDEMAKKISMGDIAGATASLNNARAYLSSTAAYSGTATELANLDSLSASFTASVSSGDFMGTRKAAMFQNYTRVKNSNAQVQEAPKDAAEGSKAP